MVLDSSFPPGGLHVGHELRVRRYAGQAVGQTTKGVHEHRPDDVANAPSESQRDDEMPMPVIGPVRATPASTSRAPIASRAARTTSLRSASNLLGPTPS